MDLPGELFYHLHTDNTSVASILNRATEKGLINEFIWALVYNSSNSMQKKNPTLNYHCLLEANNIRILGLYESKLGEHSLEL